MKVSYNRAYDKLNNENGEGAALRLRIGAEFVLWTGYKRLLLIGILIIMLLSGCQPFSQQDAEQKNQLTVLTVEFNSGAPIPNLFLTVTDVQTGEVVEEASPDARAVRFLVVAGLIGMVVLFVYALMSFATLIGEAAAIGP